MNSFFLPGQNLSRPSGSGMINCWNQPCCMLTLFHCALWLYDPLVNYISNFNALPSTMKINVITTMKTNVRVTHSQTVAFTSSNVWASSLSVCLLCWPIVHILFTPGWLHYFRSLFTLSAWAYISYHRYWHAKYTDNFFDLHSGTWTVFVQWMFISWASLDWIVCPQDPQSNEQFYLLAASGRNRN